MNKKKICWITSDNFIDVDLPLLPIINKKFELNWHVVFSKNNITYTNDFVKAYAMKFNIRFNSYFLKYRYRDFRIIIKYCNLIRSIKKNNVDIVYVNMLGYPYLFPLLFLLIGNRKVVYAIHDYIDHINIKNRFIIRIYKRFIFIYFKNFQLFSKEQFVLFHSVYKNKRTFLSPLCLKDFGESNLHPPKEYINFLYFGIIRENKGLKYLILAANRLAKKYNGRFKVTIAGKCDNWNKYMSMIESIDVFEFEIQTIKNDKVRDYFKSAHYLVLPYIDVTQSGPLFIAYNYQVPVIASDLEGFKSYIIDGENGYLFESQNFESLYNVMEHIIISNNEKYDSIKANLQEFIDKNISNKAIADRYIEYFIKF